MKADWVSVYWESVERLEWYHGAILCVGRCTKIGKARLSLDTEA